MHILGISAFYHDAAACLVTDGRIVAAAQEERFTRARHDERFPRLATDYVLKAGGVGADELSMVVFYEKPLSKFVRIVETHLAGAPWTLPSFLRALPAWTGHKLWIPMQIERELISMGWKVPKIAYTEHHESHAASAFFPSPFDEAAILTMDGVGEWTTTSIGHGRGNQTRLLADIPFPHSLGLLYSAVTQFAGFRVNSGEYKLMGLAPHGTPRFVGAMRDHLIDVRPDGSFWLNQRYFNYVGGLSMTNRRFHALFGGAPREPESAITQRDMDMARSVQVVVEDVVVKLARTAARRTGSRRLCLAGGVALNCVANRAIAESGLFDDIWIQPAAGDAGGALGAALYGWHQIQGHGRTAGRDLMVGAQLGPAFSPEEVDRFLAARDCRVQRPAPAEWAGTIARALADGCVVGLMTGRMEFGPRALGQRSILADPRTPQIRERLNARTKHREAFRPFAPAVPLERASQFFELEKESPYMLRTARVRDSVRHLLPAITHVDGSARVQTVDRDVAPRFHAILTAFGELTGVPVLVNTSFNVRGEPIVCTPEDAYRCFVNTDIDVLVVESSILHKSEQPPAFADDGWRVPAGD